MQYEHFSRHLREKYSTRLHLADQLVDQLKQKKPSAIAYLNEDRKVSEPYLNECVLAAERMKNNRRSERDRQICYENLILAEKLERIKKPLGQNVKKDFRKRGRLAVSKANGEDHPIESINRRFMTKQFELWNEKIFNFNEEKFPETEIISYHSSSPIQSESEDDQATAVDVDTSMEYCDSTPPKIHSSKNRRQNVFETENDRVYQHLTNIDMTMIRDASPLVATLQPARHFSICILPRFDSHTIKSRNNQSKVRSHDRQYAFKKEILYH